MGFKMVFLVILGLLKFVKNSPIKPVLGSVGTGPLHSLYRLVQPSADSLGSRSLALSRRRFEGTVASLAADRWLQVRGPLQCPKWVGRDPSLHSPKWV